MSLPLRLFDVPCTIDPKLPDDTIRVWRRGRMNLLRQPHMPLLPWLGSVLYEAPAVTVAISPAMEQAIEQARLSLPSPKETP